MALGAESPLEPLADQGQVDRHDHQEEAQPERPQTQRRPLCREIFDGLAGCLLRLVRLLLEFRGLGGDEARLAAGDDDAAQQSQDAPEEAEAPEVEDEEPSAADEEPSAADEEPEPQGQP